MSPDIYIPLIIDFIIIALVLFVSIIPASIISGLWAIIYFVEVMLGNAEIASWIGGSPLVGSPFVALLISVLVVRRWPAITLPFMGEVIKKIVFVIEIAPETWRFSENIAKHVQSGISIHGDTVYINNGDRINITVFEEILVTRSVARLRWKNRHRIRGLDKIDEWIKAGMPRD